MPQVDVLRTTDSSHAAYHIRRAEAAVLIKKIGHQDGWVTT